MNKFRRTTVNRRLQYLNPEEEIQNKNSPLTAATLKNVPSLRILGKDALSRKPLRVSTLLVRSSGDHHAKLGEYAAKLYKDKSMTDVMIVVQSQEFKAHKAVLACYSPYFNEVLNKPGFNEIHYLLQVTEEHFQNMVYLYVTARNLDLLDASARGFRLMVMNFEKLITTKEFLDLEVEQIIELFSTDEIGARSEVIVFMAALKWLDYDFFEREEHVEKVFKCMRFSLMTVDEILACYHPPVLPGLMERPEIRDSLLNATCYITAKTLGQESLFSDFANAPRSFLFGGEPMILWDVSLFDGERYEETKRQNAAIKIQALVRGYLTRKRLQEEIFIANYAATVMQSVFRGYRVRKSMKLTRTAMQRKGRSSKNFLLRMDDRSGLLKAYTKRTFEIFEPDIKQERHIMMYAMTGFDPDVEEANTLFLFNTLKRTWSLVTECLYPRHDARMAYLEGYIYIIGGFNPLDRTEKGIMLPLKECHRYNIAKGEWRKMPEMKEARSCHAAAVFNEQILVIGGKNEANKILSSIEKYDISVGKWKKFSPSLPEPRMAMGYTIHKGMLWIAGGITCDESNICMMDSVWGLDHKTCRWTKKVSLSQAAAFPTLVSDGDHLFCVGGATHPLSYDQGELESTDKIYSFERGRWVLQSTMPFQAHSVVSCNVGKAIYILGGFNSQTMTHVKSSICLELDEDKVEQVDNILPKGTEFIVESTIFWQ